MVPNGFAPIDDEVRQRLIAEGRAVGDALMGAQSLDPIPDGETFLVRWCRVDPGSGREPDVARIIARALDGPVEPAAAVRSLMFCAEAAVIVPDGRVADRARQAAATIAASWGGAPGTDAARALDACFRAAALLESRVIVAAVDELERIAAERYRPGRGMSGTLEADAPMASALLSGFEITGRLPYSMLAEELLETARRTLWDSGGGFRNVAHDAVVPFAANCDAASAAARLAWLHDSAEYRNVAVIAADADYRAIALRTIDRLSVRRRDHPTWAARYGLAVAELVCAP